MSATSASTPDARVDRELVGDEEQLWLLISQRLSWTYGASSTEESTRLEQALAPGPRALLVLENAWVELFDGGMVGLLSNFGHRVGEAVPAAAVVGAPAYEALFRDVVDLLPADKLHAAHYERSGQVEDLLDDDTFCKRLHALEERYYELEEEIGTPVECTLPYVREHPEEFFLSKREAAADNDDFVARLVARVGPRERAGADELAAAEAELGHPLPALLRRLYMDVGAAGWGPEAGFLPLRGADPGSVVAAWRWAHRELHGPLETDVWPHTLVPAVSALAGGWICVDTRRPMPRLVWLEASGPRGWLYGWPSLRHEAFTLRGWLEEWLRAPA